MTGREWVARLAVELGIDPPSDQEMDQLLDFAAVAAHSSERIAAPLACWLAGRAGIDPVRLADLAQGIAADQPEAP